MIFEQCPGNRPFDPFHPSCRTCQIKCISKNTAFLEVAASDISGMMTALPSPPSPGEVAELRGKNKKNKYSSQKVTIDGVTFDSKKEGARYQQLCMLEKAGVIQSLSLQVSFELAPSVIINGRKKPALRYLADFQYRQDGKRVVEDVKSEITRKDPLYRAKIHLMKSVFNIDILET